jgi:hypothetical protein
MTGGVALGRRRGDRGRVGWALGLVLVFLSIRASALESDSDSCKPSEVSSCDAILGFERPLRDRCKLFNDCVQRAHDWQERNRPQVLQWAFDDPAWLSILEPRQLLKQAAPAMDSSAPIDAAAAFALNKSQGASYSCARLNGYLNEWNVEGLREALKQSFVVEGKCAALKNIGLISRTHSFVLFSIAQEASTYVLSRTGWGKVDFARVKTFGHADLFGDPVTSTFSGKLGIVAIPNGSQAYLLVANDSPSAPMLAWPVSPGSPTEAGDRVLDLGGTDVLRTTLRLPFQVGDRIFLNGWELPASNSIVDVDVTLRRGPGLNRIVVTRTDDLRGYRVRSVRAPLMDPPAFYEHRFTQAEDRIAMLPVVANECQGHGLNAVAIKNRMSDFLKTYGKRVSDLGPLVDPARRLIDKFASPGTRSAGPTKDSRRENDPAELLAASVTEFRGRSFSELLDVRVDCSKAADGNDVVTVTVVHVDLLSMERSAAEPELFASDSHFRSESHMIGDWEAVRDGVIVPLAQLYDLPSAAFSFAPESRAVQDDIYVEFRSNHLDQALLSIRPISGLRCRNLNRLNALQGEWPHGSRRSGLSRRSIDASEDAGGERVAVQTEGAYELELSPADDAPNEALSIRCVEVKADGFELEGTYYFLHPQNPLFENPRQQRLDGGWNPALRGEKVVHRYFLFHIGPRDILTPAFGLWMTQRSGRHPPSWNDVLTSPSASEDGSIPYVVDRTSLMVGAALNGRSRLHRNATLDLRLYGLPRVEFLSLDRVPAELSTFRGTGTDDHEVTFDLTLATAILLRWELNRHLNFNAGIGVAIPKTFHAIKTGLVDEQHQTRADYEPTLPVASLGLGGGYTWR